MMSKPVVIVRLVQVLGVAAMLGGLALVGFRNDGAGGYGWMAAGVAIYVGAAAISRRKTQ